MKRSKKNAKKTATPNGGSGSAIKKNKKIARAKVRKKISKRAEKLRRLRISRGHALNRYKKLLELKNPTAEQKKLRRFYKDKIQNLNKSINIGKPSKKSIFSKLTRSRGWVMQGFGHAWIALDNFLAWLKQSFKAFKSINGLKLPVNYANIVLMASDMTYEMDSVDQLFIKYRLEGKDKKLTGWLYVSS